MADAKKLPSHMIFPMYVDMIVDTMSPGFKAKFGFSPIDEPLIWPIFADEKNRIVREESGKTLWLPSAALMLSMKIRSHPARDKEHKRVKDICDISALLLFGTIPDGLGPHLSPVDIERFRKAVTRESVAEAARIIGVGQDIVMAVFSKHRLI